MKFKTGISHTKDGVHYIKGHALTDLMEERSFTDVLCLLWRGTLPSDEERKLIEAILVASVEHGVEVPSVFVPRISASVGNDLHTTLAAGVLSIGEKHGGAAEAAAYVLQDSNEVRDVVRAFESKGKPIPGFGHAFYKEEDPRARVLYQKMKTLSLPLQFFERAYAIEAALKEAKEKKVPLNVDGAIAAALLTLGFSPRVGKALFIIPRLVGITAHVLEEYEQNNRYYRLDADDVERA